MQNAGWHAATGDSVSYSTVGSASRVTDVSQRIVDFGASDAPLTSSQESSCNHCVQIPWGLSATAIGYHLNGIATLKLSGEVLAEIYSGKITNSKRAKLDFPPIPAIVLQRAQSTLASLS